MKFFAKLGSFVDSHPWWIIGSWVVAAVVVLAFSPQLVQFTSNNNSSFLPSSYESVQAQAVAQKYFPAQQGASGSIIVSASDGAQLSTADQQKVAALASSLTSDHIESVTSVVTSPIYLSANKKAQLVQVQFKGAAGDTGPNDAVPIIRQKSTAFLSGSGLQAGFTGSEPISVDTTNAFDNAESVIAIATVLLILVLLGIVFRSPIIAVLPIVVIAVVHQMAQALTADLAQTFGFVVGPSLAPLLVVVMFGVGTDYIVFLLFRHREHVARGDEVHEGLRDAVAKVGEVIASAAATVIAAFAALLVASLESLKTLAPGLIVGVLLMLIAALTLVPAILSLLGRHLFWPSHPKLPPADKITLAQRDGRIVARHPAIVLTICSLVLLGLASGIFGMKITYNQLAELPSSTPSQQAYNTMASNFPPGDLGPTQVYAAASKPLDPNQVNALAAKLAKTTGVAQVLPVQYNANKDAAEITVLLKNNPYSTTALDNVAGPVRTAAHGSIPGANVLVGGTTSQLVDVRAALKLDMKHIFPLALGIVLVILALLLRSVVAPLYLLIGVMLTYAATLGVTVLVFVNGFAFTGLDFSIPIIVYLFVMAIGTDYNILIASRLREEFDAGQPPHEAARLAVVHGSPAVNSAGLVLAGTFASLLLTGIQLLEEIGFAVAFGVLLASMVLSTRIVPTIAALRGWHFWWPHRIHQKTAANKEELEAQPAREAATSSSG